MTWQGADEREAGWRAAIAAGQTLPAATGIDAILDAQRDTPPPAEGG